MPNIQPVSKAQPAQVGQPSNAPSSQTPPTQVGTQGEPSSSQALLSVRQQQPAQPSISVPPASVPPLNFPSQPIPSALSAPQTKSFPPMQVPSIPPAQASQVQNITLPPPAPPHYSTLPPHIPMVPVQPHQALQNPGLFNQLLQPPLPIQPRPMTMQPFSNQLQPHMAHPLGFQPSNAPQQLLQKPLFHVSWLLEPSILFAGEISSQKLTLFKIFSQAFHLKIPSCKDSHHFQTSLHLSNSSRCIYVLLDKL